MKIFPALTLVALLGLAALFTGCDSATRSGEEQNGTKTMTRAEHMDLLEKTINDPERQSRFDASILLPGEEKPRSVSAKELYQTMKRPASQKTSSVAKRQRNSSSNSPSCRGGANSYADSTSSGTTYYAFTECTPGSTDYVYVSYSTYSGDSGSAIDTSYSAYVSAGRTRDCSGQILMSAEHKAEGDGFKFKSETTHQLDCYPST